MSVASLPDNAFQPRTRAEWRRWLARHHTRPTGVWLVLKKVGVAGPRVTYDEAVEEALCFGWIDSKPRTLDASRSMLWLAPRKPRSAWARTNKARVARLIADGRMTPAGLAKVEHAKRDGSWAALDAVDAMVTPSDLARAFRAHPGARARFSAFPPSVKRGILAWILGAKQALTRARRVEATARLAARGERANQWRPAASGDPAPRRAPARGSATKKPRVPARKPGR